MQLIERIFADMGDVIASAGDLLSFRRFGIFLDDKNIIDLLAFFLAIFVFATIILIWILWRTRLNLKLLRRDFLSVGAELEREKIWRRASGDNRMKVTSSDLRELERAILMERDIDDI